MASIDSVKLIAALEDNLELRQTVWRLEEDPDESRVLAAQINLLQSIIAAVNKAVIE